MYKTVETSVHIQMFWSKVSYVALDVVGLTSPFSFDGHSGSSVFTHDVCDIVMTVVELQTKCIGVRKSSFNQN